MTSPMENIRQHYLRGGFLTVGMAYHLYGTHDLRRVNSRLNKEFKHGQIKGEFENGQNFKTYRFVFAKTEGIW